MTEALPDLSIRQEALSPEASFHVESPAGAGKTSLLTARFIHLLAQVNHPREILALTFTNKAAHEMQERIKGPAPIVPIKICALIGSQLKADSS
jgi:ATP-dependent helicase/nuclease subunit A